MSAPAPRPFDSDNLVIASHNKGKVREIGDLLHPYHVTCMSADELNLPEPEETETTFEGNAALKALAAAKASGKPALADDSGLCVNALGGDPGIYSARWAIKDINNPDKDFSYAMEKVLDLLGKQEPDDRSAFFACALCLAWPDGHTETFVGKVHGTLTDSLRGDKGFGYDPLFVPDGFDITFAEMDPAAKHKISHRAQAFGLLIDACFKNA